MRTITRKIEFSILKLISKSPFLCSVYYIFNNSFRKEHHSVVNGRLSAYKESQGALYQLRRDIHRIEKGLLMKPFRNIFAMAYIEDTIKSFEIVINSHIGEYK